MKTVDKRSPKVASVGFIGTVMKFSTNSDQWKVINKSSK